MSEAQTIESTFFPKPPPDASCPEIESAATASATFVGNQIDMATVTSSQMELNSQTLDPYPNHLENNPEEEENDYWERENEMKCSSQLQSSDLRVSFYAQVSSECVVPRDRI